ncbi:MAG: hypothetical protein JWQ59_37 [Cryobacterium sp.]|nr:hypothetical protein [Cryobacterium sp.]
MDLVEILRAAGRRWYVLVAGILVTLGLALIVLRLVPVAYEVKSSILLLPPNSAVTATGNPFLSLGGLEIVSGVLAKSLTDSETVEGIVPPGSRAEYTVAEDVSVSGSVLEIAVSDDSARGAFAILNAVVDVASTRLEQLQDAVNASRESQVRLMVITNNNTAELNIAPLARALIVVVAAALVLTFLLAVSIDALARRRAARNNAPEKELVSKEDSGQSPVARAPRKPAHRKAPALAPEP